MKRIKIALAYDFKANKGEVNTLPSETIPGQALSVPEMIRRSQAGLSVAGVRAPLYTGEDEVPDFSRMDISELVAFREHNERIIREYREAVNKKEKEMYDERIRKATENKIRKEQKMEEKLGGRQAASTAVQKGGLDE